MPSSRCSALSLRVLRHLFAASLILVSTAYGQLPFTHLLDSSTVRPDASATGQPTFGPFDPTDFNNPLGFTVPVTDGKVVAFNVGLYASAFGSSNGFAPCSLGSENSLWTIPISGGTPTKVAGYGINLYSGQSATAMTTTCAGAKIGKNGLYYYGSYQFDGSIGTHTGDGVYQVPVGGGASSGALVVGGAMSGTTLLSVFDGIYTAPDGTVSTTGGLHLSSEIDPAYDELFLNGTSSYHVEVGMYPPADCNAAYPAAVGWQFSYQQMPVLYDGTNYVTNTIGSGFTLGAGDQLAIFSSSTPGPVDCNNIVFMSSVMNNPTPVPMPGAPSTAVGEWAVHTFDTDGGRSFFLMAQPYSPTGGGGLRSYQAIYQLVGGSLVKIVGNLDAFPWATFDTTACTTGYTGYPSNPSFGLLTVRGNWLVTSLSGYTSFDCATGTSTGWNGSFAINLTTKEMVKIVAAGDVLENGQTNVVSLLSLAGFTASGALASDGHYTFMTDSTTKGGASEYVLWSTNLNAIATQTALTAVPSPQTYFQNVTLTAKVTTKSGTGGTPTGSVQFLDGTTSLGTASLDSTGTATMTLDTLAIGGHTLTAVYAGQDPYAGSTSPTTSLAITKGSTSTSLTASTPKIATSAPVTFTATVSPTPSGGTPTGTVTFADGGVTIATANVTGTGVATTPWSSTVLGAHTISAVYNGDPNFAGSTAPSITETVTTPTVNPILTVVFQPGVSVIYGTAVTINVSLTPPAGSSGVPTQSVTASVDGGGPLTQSLAGGSASFNLGVPIAGTHNVTVAYAGDTNFSPATQTLQLLVLKAPLTVSAGNGTRSYGSPNPAFPATVTGLENGDAITASASSIATTTSPVGTYPVATVLADPNSRLSNYTVTSIAGSLTVTPVPITVTMNSITAVYGQNIPLPSANISGILAQDAGNGNVTVTIGIAATSSSPVGTYVIPVTLSGSAAGNYTLVVPGNPAVTITQAPLTVKVNNASRVYGAANPAFIGVVAGVVNGDSLTTTYSSSATPASSVGTYPITAVVSGARASNYMVQVTNGVLTVTQAALTVTANNASRAYGAANPALSGTVTGTVNGDAITVTYSTTATAASAVGSYPIAVAVSGANVADYAAQTTAGTLTVTQAGSAVTLSLSSQSTAAGSPVTLTAQVTSVTTGTPTGTITFLDGSTSLGTAILNAQGSAALSISTLSLGTHLLVLSYAGDQNFMQSQSATAPEMIGTADYTVVTTPASATIKAGQSAQFALVLTSLFGFAQPISLSCTNLPVGAACNFVPSGVTPSAAGTNASLTVTTTAASASLQPWPGWGSTLVPTLACCIWVTLRRRRLQLRLALTLVMLCGVALTGCGGGTSGSTTPSATPTPAGTDSIIVNATSGSGNSAHTVQITVIVTP